MVEDACATCGSEDSSGSDVGMGGGNEDGIDDNENLVKGLRMLRKKRDKKK